MIFTLLGPGQYSIIIRDANNCDFTTDPISVIDPGGPAISLVTPTEATCGADNGSINIQATGGVGTLSYSIDGVNYQDSGDFIDLMAGMYTVSVRDGNNCEVTENAVNVAKLTSPVIDDIQPVKATCGSDNASITISASGGTGTLAYSVDGTNFQSNNEFTLLPGGNYVITIRDANNCMATSTSVNVASDDSPQFDNIEPTSSTCGASNGSLVAIVSGGVGLLEYSINGTDFKAIIALQV